MKITTSSPVTLTRSTDHITRTYPGGFTNLRQLGQIVAYYYADNGLASRAEATRMGMEAEAEFRIGQPYTALGVTFTIARP